MSPSGPIRRRSRSQYSSSGPSRMSRTDDMSTSLGGPLSAQEAVEVFAHHLGHVSCRIEVSDLLEPTERFCHALGVRVVRAEEDMVGAHECDEALEVVLPERVDPDVSQEDVAGMLEELLGHLLIGHL